MLFRSPKLLKSGITGENILVVHDELEKKFSHISIRFGGSARGHNGLRSIIDIIGKEYWRLRLGIDRPENKSDVSSYVLSRFSHDELDKISEILESAASQIGL